MVAKSVKQLFLRILNSIIDVEPELNNYSHKSSGWNWSSFLLGPFWYLINEMIGKGVILLIITFLTVGFGIPIIWFYCGLRGNSDLYERNLKRRSKYDIKRL